MSRGVEWWWRLKGWSPKLTLRAMQINISAITCSTLDSVIARGRHFSVIEFPPSHHLFFFPCPPPPPPHPALPHRECRLVDCPDHRAVPAARSSTQTYSDRRLQEQCLFDLATQRPWGWGCSHLLYHRGLQVRISSQSKKMFERISKKTVVLRRWLSPHIFTSFDRCSWRLIMSDQVTKREHSDYLGKKRRYSSLGFFIS